MLTQAQLGVRHPDGTITGCYVHYDGYPRHMIAAIDNYLSYNTTTGLTVLITDAQSYGGIRSFNPPPHRETLFLGGSDIFIINESNWGEEYMHGVEFDYAYLVDYETGDIICCEI